MKKVRKNTHRRKRDRNSIYGNQHHKNFITIYHTEVNLSVVDRGLWKKLLHFVVNYAKNNDLKIIPLCPFVLVQFKNNEVEYVDI